MKSWFLNLAPRERWLVIAATAVALLLGMYVFVIEPLAARKAMLERQVTV